MSRAIAYFERGIELQPVLRLAREAGTEVEVRQLPLPEDVALPPWTKLAGRLARQRLAADWAHMTDMDGRPVVLVGHALPLIFPECKGLQILEWRAVTIGQWYAHTVWYGRVPATTFPAHEYDVVRFWQTIRTCDEHGFWDARAADGGCPECCKEIQEFPGQEGLTGVY